MIWTQQDGQQQREWKWITIVKITKMEILGEFCGSVL